MPAHVVNIVVTADMRQPLKLIEIGKLEGGSYNPQMYACAYVKRARMFGVVSVFSTGKMISVGTRSLGQARSDLVRVARILTKECGASLVTPRVTIRNVVAHFDLGVRLDLNRLESEIPGTEYNPELFPALVWRPTEFPGSFLIFGSGKGVAMVKRLGDVGAVVPFLSRAAGIRKGDSNH